MAFSSESTNKCDHKIKIYPPCYPLPLTHPPKKTQPTLRQYYVTCCCCRSLCSKAYLTNTVITMPDKSK